MSDAFITVSPPGSHPASTVRRVLAHADALGLDHVYPAARELASRGDRLKGVTADAGTERERGRQKLLERLVDDTVDLETAATELAAVEALANQAGALPRLCKEASDTAFARAWQQIRAYGDGIVDDLRPLAEHTVSEAVRLAGALSAEVTDDADAIAAGGDAAATWSALVETAQTWAAVHRLADEVRSAGAAPVDEPGGYPQTYAPLRYRFARPAAAATGTVSGPLWLAEAHAAGAQPGVYSAAEVAARETVPAAGRRVA